MGFSGGTGPWRRRGGGGLNSLERGEILSIYVDNKVSFNIFILNPFGTVPNPYISYSLINNEYQQDQLTQNNLSSSYSQNNKE